MKHVVRSNFKDGGEVVRGANRFPIGEEMEEQYEQPEPQPSPAWFGLLAVVRWLPALFAIGWVVMELLVDQLKGMR